MLKKGGGYILWKLEKIINFPSLGVCTHNNRTLNNL